MMRFRHSLLRRFFILEAEEGKVVTSPLGKGPMNPVGHKFECHTYLAFFCRTDFSLVITVSLYFTVSIPFSTTTTSVCRGW